MSFATVAVAIGFEGMAATLVGGAMLGGTMTIGANLLTGQDPFANIGKGIIMGGLTAGLTPAVAQALEVSQAAAAGITAAGLNTAATGDLSKGLVAGLGAYGMAGLSANLNAPPVPGVDPSAALNTVNPTSTLTSYTGDPDLAGYINSSSSLPASTPAANNFSGTAGSALTNYTGDPALANYISTSSLPAVSQPYLNSDFALNLESSSAPVSKPSLRDTMSARYDAVAKDPKAFLKANASNLMYAAAPLLAGADLSEDDMPQMNTRPGMIRPYSFDPYSGQYTAGKPYQAAEGGLMGMDDGGYSPGQLNFAQRSEPVVRMASGGLASFAVGGGVSNEDIQAYMNANQGVSDATIAAKMQETGVSPQQLASAMGYDPQIIAQKYAAAVGAPTFAPGDPNSPYYQSSLPPAAATAPAYTNYSTEDITGYLQANPNANIAAAIKEKNADPAAVNKAIGLLALNKIGADFSDPTQTGRGTGSAQYVDAFNKYGIDAAELFAANKATNPNYTFAGDNTAGELTRAFKTAKDFKGFDPQASTQALKDVEWVKKMDTTGASVTDIARFTGLPTGEVQSRVDAARATMTRVCPSGSHYDPVTSSCVPNINATQNTTTTVDKPTDINVAPATALPVGVSGAGVTTINPNGTITTTPNIPNRPAGGFTGMTQVKDAYTKGGGSLGYTPYVPKTIEEFDNKYTSRLTGGSKQAYDYLTGKTPYNPKPYTATGELQRPYSEAALGRPADLSTKQYLFDAKTRTYKVNPDYVIPTTDSKGVVTPGLTNKEVTDYVDTKPSETEFLAWATTNNLSDAQIAAATGMTITEVRKKLNRPKDKAATTTAGSNNIDPATGEPYPPYTGAANGGLMAMARGGATEQYDLGGYSDGGRLLRGPGNGTSDDIPATIGNKRPARLADGEFVIPSRIVSELGNGSTEAGARQLYAMMERIQKARGKTVGKDKVAFDAKARNQLPA